MEDNFRELKIHRNDFDVRLEQSRKEKKLIDVQLQIGEKLFDAHRIILSLYSPVLEAAISDQWSTTKICSISDEYVDSEIVEDLLSFLYTGSIKLTPDNVQPVCMAAHFLQIPLLLEPSVDYLCELISIENVLELFLFSVSCQLDVLRNGCLRFIIANYEKVFQDSEILNFRFESLKNLLLGLAEHFWGTGLREHTFDCIVRWTEKNLSERLEHLPILLKNIPLVELPVEFLEQTVSKHPLVTKSDSCDEILSNAIANNETSWKTKDNLVVIGRYRKENALEWEYESLRSMFLYDSKESSWKRLPNASEQYCKFGATVVGAGNIIVSGDPGSGYETDTIEMFDWLTQTWSNLPKMPLPMRKQSMATLDGNLYIAGEVADSRDTSDHIEIPDIDIICEHAYPAVVYYSFESKQWKFIEQARYLRLFDYLIPYKDHLYAIGSDQFQKYDPAQNQWTALEPPEIWSGYFVATLHQDRIYWSSTFDFRVYDPQTDRWSDLPPPPVRETTIVSLNGKLLAVGGLEKNSEKKTDLIYEFDLETQQWNEFGKLPAGVSPHERHHCLVGGFH